MKELLRDTLEEGEQETKPAMPLQSKAAKLTNTDVKSSEADKALKKIEQEASIELAHEENEEEEEEKAKVKVKDQQKAIRGKDKFFADDEEQHQEGAERNFKILEVSRDGRIRGAGRKRTFSQRKDSKPQASFKRTVDVPPKKRDLKQDQK